MPAMRTDLGFGGLMTPAGYYDEMIMGGSGAEPALAPAEAAPAALPPAGVAGGYSSYEAQPAPAAELPPAGIAGGYGSAPAGDPYAGQSPPVYLDQAVGPSQDPYGGYSAAVPLPDNPNGAPTRAWDTEPANSISPLNPYRGQNLEDIPGSIAYGGTNLSALERKLTGREVQPAGDPYVKQLPGVGDGIGVTPTPFSPTLDDQSAWHGERPMADQQNILRGTWLRGQTDPYAAYGTQRSDIMTLPASQPPVATGAGRQQGDGTGTGFIPTLGPGNPDLSWTQNMDQPTVPANTFPESAKDEVIFQEQWRPDVGSNTQTGGGQILDAVGGALAPVAEVARAENSRMIHDQQQMEAQRQNAEAQRAEAGRQAGGAPYGLSEPRLSGGRVGPGGAGSGTPPLTTLPSYIADVQETNPVGGVRTRDPYSDLMGPGGAGTGNRPLPLVPQQQVDGSSAGATPGTDAVVNDGDVTRNRASKLLTPDLQFVDSERTSDAWGAGTGSNQVRVITGEGVDRFGTDALVTPDSLQAAEAAGMAGWNLNDTEFQALVEAGLVVPEAKGDVVGQTLLIPKDWVDALGGVPATGDALTNVQDVVATDPYAADTGTGGGGGKTWVDYGSRSSGRSGGYSGGGRGTYGGGGGWSDWGGAGGGYPAAAAWETSDEGSPFDNPIFARYFEVLSRHFGADRANTMMRGGFGRSLGRKGRSRSVGGKRMTTKGRSSVRVPDGASVEFGGEAIRTSVNASIGKGKKDS